METFIVLIPLEENRSAREQCELIQNTHFKIEPKKDGYQKLTAHKVLLEIDKVLDTSLEVIEVYDLNSFMDDFNDEEINADDYFMSYVSAELLTDD